MVVENDLAHVAEAALSEVTAIPRERLATDEPECQIPDAWKRQRLIGVGADYIIPNYLDYRELLAQVI